LTYRKRGIAVKLLVVEDEKELLDSIAEGLRLSGYAVDTASDGEEAQEMCYVENYDLIVLDINLPKMDGFTVLQKIREEDKLVNVIMLTARTQIKDRVKGLDLGADDYIVKPFDFNELMARIRAVVRRKYGNSSNKLVIGNLVLNIYLINPVFSTFIKIFISR